MSDDKAFATWALLLIAGAGLLATALVTSGIAEAPALGWLLDHAALGLAIRFAYKWVGGFDWADWSVRGDGAVAVRAELADADLDVPGAPA